MRHTFCATLGFLLITFVFVLTLATPQMTGAVTESFYSGSSADVTLNHLVLQNYGVKAVQFPVSECGRTAQEWYNIIAHEPLPETEASSTIFFDTRKGYGEAKLNQGRIIIEGNIYRGNEEMPLLLDLSGDEGKRFDVSKGFVKTKEYSCTFSNQEGKAACKCKSLL